MKEKEKKRKKEAAGKANLSIPMIVIAVIIVLALAGSVFFGLMGSGIAGKSQSQVSKDEIKDARSAMNSAEDSEEDVYIEGIDEAIAITPSGAKSEENSDETTAGDGDYILPDSDTKALTDADVSGLSAYDLYLARNEIFARHGRIFDNQDLKDYFGSKSWYKGTVPAAEFDADAESILSDVERANIELIKKYE